MTKEKGLEIKSMHIKYVFTEEEKKEITSQLTGEINGAAAAVSRYSREYNQGYTYKNHDCYEIFDYESKQVFTHRADTDEQVSVRTMTSTEFQREMFDPREEVKEENEDDSQEVEEIPDDTDASLLEDEELGEEREAVEA